MKKRLLSAILIISVVFAAVGCSYTFKAPIVSVVTDSNGDAVESGRIYMFLSEENAKTGKEILEKTNPEESRDIMDYAVRDAAITEGEFHIYYNWTASSPSGGKDYDTIDVWFVATDGTNVSEVIKGTCTSDSGLDSIDITI